MNDRGFGGHTTLSKGEIKKKADSLYKSSFEDLDDGTVYRDPLGMRAGQQVNLQKEFYQAREDIRNQFNDYQRKGFSVSDSIREIRKNLDTGDWSLPIDYVPDVFVVNPEMTPMADMIARETTQSDTVLPTRVTDDPDPTFGLETTDDTEGSYDYDDPAWADAEYGVEGLGFATRVEDKLILAANQLRGSEQVQQQAMLRGMRKAVERQIIKGTNNDAAGWDGFDDLGTVALDNGDPESPTDEWDTFLRELIDETEYEGAPRNSLAIVTDFDTHREIREALVSNVKYNDPTTELLAGFSTLEFDDVPIFKSHAVPRTSELAADTTSNQVYCVNMEANYLSVLQETSVKPLAKIAPQEQFAVDAYHTLVSEAPSHIQIGSVTTPA